MLALLFPGQGSHTPDDASDVSHLAPELLARCVELLGVDPFPRIEESTRFAQPTIFITSVARARATDLPREAGAFAGHSVGEFAALVTAGALDVDDGLRLVIERGRLMAECRPGAMVAVRGDVDTATDLAAAHGWVVANDNAPGQVVLAGDIDRVQNLIDDADTRGVRSIRLNVAGAFHSPLMAPAAASFGDALRDVAFRTPTANVWCCATAQPFDDPRRQLAEALTAPVRWREVLLSLDAAGADVFADVGPGRVLEGLTRRTLPAAGRITPDPRDHG
ncbi:MAG: acyltransferase domain-containing protein [Solirubrobacteraceae bacterium]